MDNGLYVGRAILYWMKHVVVIGGGVTGCGIARDLALRGVGVTVIERADLIAGTSSRSHNLLHSGARYADIDEECAAACKAESDIITRIGGATVAEISGVFVALSDNEREYLDKKKRACQSIGIPVRDLDVEEFKNTEPSITRDVSGAFRVPDSVFRPKKLVAATIHSAENHGARIRCQAEVTDFIVRNQTVLGVVVDEGGSEVVIPTDFVVNASGPWASQVASTAGVSFGMQLTRGTIIEFDYSSVSRVINRCRPPSDGDILVPNSGSLLAGTTSVPVESPCQIEPDQREIEKVATEAKAMVPELDTSEMTRVFGGIRPLFGESTARNRDVSRQYQLLDHDERNGLQRFVSVVGGKYTTHRLIAERVGDHVATRIDVDEESQTASRPLPGANDPSHLTDLVKNYL